MKTVTTVKTITENGKAVEETENTLDVFTYDGLNETARDYAFEKWQSRQFEDPFLLEAVSDELLESLKAVVEQSGYVMRDYSLGLSSNRSQRLELDHRDCDELQGKRALAWYENNIAGPLRVPFIPPFPKSRVVYTDKDGKRPTTRTKINRAYYRPGTVPSCPFTGVCYDETFLKALYNGLSDGREVREALQDLADVFSSELDAENDYRTSRDCFEEFDAHESTYLADGRVYED